MKNSATPHLNKQIIVKVEVAEPDPNFKEPYRVFYGLTGYQPSFETRFKLE